MTFRSTPLTHRNIHLISSGLRLDSSSGDFALSHQSFIFDVFCRWKYLLRHPTHCVCLWITPVTQSNYKIFCYFQLFLYPFIASSKPIFDLFHSSTPRFAPGIELHVFCSALKNCAIPSFADLVLCSLSRFIFDRQ